MVAQIKAWEPQASGPGGFADESALVAGLRAGTPEAFEALHAAYAVGIYNLALRIVGDSHEAEDVAQEVLVKVLRGLPREKGEFRLPAWLYRVTVNAAFDHVRTRKRRPVTIADDAVAEPASPVDEFERAELAHRVEATLRELPKRQQLALVLRDVHGLSVGETASVLGVTRASADVLLTRARAGFRKLYLAGTRVAGRCAEADRILSGGVGGGVSARQRARLKEHEKICPDCRRTVELWGAAPVGLGLLLPQVALPAKLSLGATLAAAKAAGVALPAGLGAAAAAGAATAAAGSGAAAGAGATAVTSAAASGAASAASAAGVSHGVLELIGSAAGVKIATLAAVATAAFGVAEVASHDHSAARTTDVVTAAAQRQSSRAEAGGHGAGTGLRPRGSGSSASARQYAGLPLSRRHGGAAPADDLHGENRKDEKAQRAGSERSHSKAGARHSRKRSDAAHSGGRSPGGRASAQTGRSSAGGSPQGGGTGPGGGSGAGAEGVGTSSGSGGGGQSPAE